MSTLGEDLTLSLPSSPDQAVHLKLWWTEVPPLPGEKLGVIGDFASPSPEATQVLLAQACESLRAHGCTLAVGPMDGNTWRKYRFVTDPGTEPPFFLEAWNSAAYPEWWRRCGFTELATYSSAAVSDLSVRDERVGRTKTRLLGGGVALRPLNPADFAAELARIYEVSVVSFQQNYLYTPLPLAAFTAQYEQIRARVRPDLVILAEHEGRPVGYVFAIPDLAQAARGEQVTTVVLKTLAVLPGRAYMGLGAVLTDELHQAARRAGYARAIHAYMHESNKSRNLSAHYGSSIRRYTLFQKRLVA